MPPKKRANPPAPADNDLNPSAMKVAELKEELEKRGLETNGRKAELLARLEDALKSGPSQKKKIKVETGDLDYSKMKLADLRKELESQGLDTSGKKAELVARLEGVSSNTKKAAGKSTQKKAKEEIKEEDEVPKAEEIEETDFSKAKRALASAGPSKKGPKKHKVDSLCSMRFGVLSVCEDWDCMLNQTNIGHNNNKYYIIQLLQRSSGYVLYTRWGRVGEPGQQATKEHSNKEDGIKDFKKKFTDKTKNKWENRANFEPKPGKYTLLEMDDDDDEADEEMATKLAALDEPDFGVLPAVKKVRPCTLDQPTQKLLELIFNMDMFNHAMKDLEIDTKKMPLGKLSKVQIAKGFEALEAVEMALDEGAPRSKVAELTSKFYTCIPHDFGRRTPPPLDDKEKLQKKFDMLVILGDIELAQGLKKDQDKKKLEVQDVSEVPHQLDVQYESLKTDLTLLEASSHEHQVIVKYMKATEPKWRNLKLQHVWRVHRHNVEERYRAHDDLTNRRLLWHGTNVAVVAAILKSGLRIMPHSGGRVGKGIYLASENSKSAGYVRCSANHTGIMFLNEAALGKEKIITMDDHTLTTPPKGYDSVLAKGQTEPDPKADITLTLDGKAVQVPQGSPIPTSYSNSNFSQSEYLVYKESQACIRYMLQIKFA